MGNAYQVARELLDIFSQRNMMSTTCRPFDVGNGLTPASMRAGVTEWVDNDAAFAGIAVQCVGYEPDIEDGKVYIYTSKGSMRALNKLQREIDGVPIILRKISPIAVNPDHIDKRANQPNIYRVGDRCACGSSCALSHLGNMAGTMGAIIKKDDELFIMSNNHVIGGCNHAAPDSIVVSPSAMDSGFSRIMPVEVARLSQVVPFPSALPNYVAPCRTDVAIARITKPENISSWQGDNQNGYDTPIKIAPPSARARVKKIGRTTGLTYGVIESSILGPSAVPYTSPSFNATVYFSEYWTVRGENGPFALSGDSGSLVVSEDSSAAIGLIFATDKASGAGCFIRMDTILEAIGGGELVSGYGTPEPGSQGAGSS